MTQETAILQGEVMRGVACQLVESLKQWMRDPSKMIVPNPQAILVKMQQTFLAAWTVNLGYAARDQ